MYNLFLLVSVSPVPNRFIKSLQNSVRGAGCREQTSDLFRHAWDRLKQFPRHDVKCSVESEAFFSLRFQQQPGRSELLSGGPLGRRIVRPLCVFKKSFKAPSQKVIYYRTGNTEHSVPASLRHHVCITHDCPRRSVWFGH